MCIGFVLYKKKIISDQGSSDIGKMLLYLVIPVVIINSFCVERTAETTTALLHSAVIAAVAMAIAMLISTLIYGRKDGISTFSCSFSNAGFIGIPLVQAVLGSSAVFYISMMIVLVNILQWTYGVFTITGDKSVMSLKKVASNPIVISVLIGIILYFSGITLPETATSIFTLVGNLNTPLAMIVSGVYLAQSDLLKALKNFNVYKVSLLRLVIIPLVTLLIFKYLPFGSLTLKQAILIAAACPVGSNVAIYAQQYHKDYHSAVEQVCVSTLFCLITLPVIMTIASALL